MKLDFSNNISIKIIKDFFNDFIKQNKDELHCSILDELSFIRKHIQYGMLYNYSFINYVEINKVEDYAIISIIFKNTNVLNIISKISNGGINIKVIDNVNNFIAADYIVDSYSSMEKSLTNIISNVISLKDLKLLKPLKQLVTPEKELLNKLIDIEEKIKLNIIDFLHYFNFSYDLENNVFKNEFHSIKFYPIVPKISLNNEKNGIEIFVDICFTIDGDHVIRRLPYNEFLEEFLLYI